MVIDAHNVLNNHMHEKQKKEAPPQKTEEEAKELAFAQAKLNSNAYCACGKRDAVRTYAHRKKM